VKLSRGIQLAAEKTVDVLSSGSCTPVENTDQVRQGGKRIRGDETTVLATMVYAARHGFGWVSDGSIAVEGGPIN